MGKTLIYYLFCEGLIYKIYEKYKKLHRQTKAKNLIKIPNGPYRPFFIKEDP